MIVSVRLRFRVNARSPAFSNRLNSASTVRWSILEHCDGVHNPRRTPFAYAQTTPPVTASCNASLHVSADRVQVFRGSEAHCHTGPSSKPQRCRSNQTALPMRRGSTPHAEARASTIAKPLPRWRMTSVLRGTSSTVGSPSTTSMWIRSSLTSRRTVGSSDPCTMALVTSSEVRSTAVSTVSLWTAALVTERAAHDAACAGRVLGPHRKAAAHNRFLSWYTPVPRSAWAYQMRRPKYRASNEVGGGGFRSRRCCLPAAPSCPRRRVPDHRRWEHKGIEVIVTHRAVHLVEGV